MSDYAERFLDHAKEIIHNCKTAEQMSRNLYYLMGWTDCLRSCKVITDAERDDIKASVVGSTGFEKVLIEFTEKIG